MRGVCKIKTQHGQRQRVGRCLANSDMSNDILYIDFVAMDEFNNQDYVLAIVDGLTRFVQDIPCHKSITGEKTLRLILKEWIQKFDKPT